MERVLQYLERQSAEDTDCWPTRYVLLLWLAILVIIPFSMATFDDGRQQPIAERWGAARAGVLCLVLAAQIV